VSDAAVTKEIAVTSPEHYENLVIGSGEGGKYLAWHMASSGHRTAVVERRLIGGSCPNTNCLPSKNEIWSAKVADFMRHGAAFGSMVASPHVDMARVLARKKAMVDGLIKIHLDNFKATGAALIMGTARLTGPKTVSVVLNDGGTKVLTADRLFLNLGTRAAIPDVAGLAAAGPMTHIEALELDRLPGRLIVIGGGYVGLELAQAFRRFGSNVTILETGPQIAAREDADVGAALIDLLRDEGIEVLLSARLLAVSGRSGEQVSVRLRQPEGEREITGTDLLVAAGRIPNTQEIGLDRAGVDCDARGYIAVNDRLETSAPDVWAIGECAGSPQFTHASMDDYRVIRDNLAGGQRSTGDRLMPYCLFTDPPMARVGLSEAEAARRGIPARVARIPTAAVLRSRTMSETRGFLKAVIGDDDRILGFTMLGPEAGEVMTVVQTAMLARMPYTALRDAVIAHPTMAEGLNVLFAGSLVRAGASPG
jgi:pyruvate/2-oxoglutarate dehydrogenase complex dihydrolipoamide dehydrogenase (E3) component